MQPITRTVLKVDLTITPDFQVGGRSGSVLRVAVGRLEQRFVPFCRGTEQVLRAAAACKLASVAAGRQLQRCGP